LLCKKQWKNASSSNYTLIPKAYAVAYGPSRHYNFHPYPILATRGYTTETGKVSFAELTTVYAEHKEHIKAMEATWYERNKQVEAEKDKLYKDFQAEKDKVYKEFEAEKNKLHKQLDAEKDKLHVQLDAEKKKLHKQLDAEKDKLHVQLEAKQAKLYREMTNHVRENSRLEVI